jgi:putative DNA primase/helicase
VVLNADIQVVTRAAFHEAEHLVPVWLPNGGREGHEWVALNPIRPDARLGSFKVNMRTCQWADFATSDKGGDLVSLYGYLKHLRQGKAAWELAQELGLESRMKEQPYTKRSHSTPTPTIPPKARWQLLTPVPQYAPPPPKAHPRCGQPSRVWTYLDAEGAVQCYLYRFDFINEHGGPDKDIFPLTYCRHTATGQKAWRWQGLSAPRPLYNPDKLAANPHATVTLRGGLSHPFAHFLIHTFGLREV